MKIVSDAPRLMHAAGARLADLSIMVVAAAGLWLFWSQYSFLSGLSWWYDSVHQLRSRAVVPRPDYELSTLDWRVANARVFEVSADRIKLITGAEPFGYQAFATVNAKWAAAADIQFDVEVETGGVTIGLVQGGSWIAANSSRTPGRFADWNSAQLGFRRSLTLVVANDNPAGESRATIRVLRLFLRK